MENLLFGIWHSQKCCLSHHFWTMAMDMEWFYSPATTCGMGYRIHQIKCVRLLTFYLLPSIVVVVIVVKRLSSAFFSCKSLHTTVSSYNFFLKSLYFLFVASFNSRKCLVFFNTPKQRKEFVEHLSWLKGSAFSFLKITLSSFCPRIV